MGTPAPLSPPDSARLRHTLRHCSVLIAMHPDQATEYVVSCALALGKPWAIVPCCVFADLFPNRPAAVRTTAEFCDYLAAKAGATLEYLRFEGKNKVVVRDAAAPRRDVAITEPRDPAHVVSGVKTDLMFERMREHDLAA